MNRRTANQSTRNAKAKREYALERMELRETSTPRVPAAGVTSFPVKAQDETIRRLIEAALAKRNS